MSDNLYEGEPDERQADGPVAEEHPFRKRYRRLTQHEVEQHDAVKEKAAELYDLINTLPAGREIALAKTTLETCIMWAVKGLTK